MSDPLPIVSEHFDTTDARAKAIGELILLDAELKRWLELADRDLLPAAVTSRLRPPRSSGSRHT